MQKKFILLLGAFVVLTGCSSYEKNTSNSNEVKYTFDKPVQDSTRSHLTIITKEKTVAEKTASGICGTYYFIKQPSILDNGLTEFVVDCVYH